MLNRIDSKAPFRHSEDFFASVASRVLSSRIRWYQFCGPALSCGLPNFPSLSANEVDVLVVVLKLSGESVLLSGMEMEVSVRGVKTVENVLLLAPVPCNASINKRSASHFCPVRVRIHSLC